MQGTVLFCFYGMVDNNGVSKELLVISAGICLRSVGFLWSGHMADQLGSVSNRT